MLVYERDVLADFRAIYHLSWSEALSLPGPEFFALAVRLPAYPGMCRVRAEEEDRKTTRNVRPGARIVESERQKIESDPLLAGLIDFG